MVEADLVLACLQRPEEPGSYGGDGKVRVAERSGLSGAGSLERKKLCPAPGTRLSSPKVVKGKSS